MAGEHRRPLQHDGGHPETNRAHWKMVSCSANTHLVTLPRPDRDSTTTVQSTNSAELTYWQ